MGVEQVVKVAMVLALLPTRRALESAWARAMAASPEIQHQGARSVAGGATVMESVTGMGAVTASLLLSPERLGGPPMLRRKLSRAAWKTACCGGRRP